MKQLFLTSSVNEVAHDVVKHCDLSKGNQLLFIDTPAEVEGGDMQWLENDRQSLVDAGFAVANYTITGKKISNFEKDFEGVNFVYFSGGDTLYLLQKSQKSGFIPFLRDLVLKRGVVYIGTSAGSIIAGEKCPDYLIEEKRLIELENQEGYGLVDFTIVPHWGSDFFRELYLHKRLEIAYKKNQVPLILLTDSQYVFVKDDWYQIVEVKGK